MSDFRIRSTSSASAECSDIVLRETATTRLVFRPKLVENPKAHEASVDGVFIFQRKGQNENWLDLPAEPLSGLKKDEGYKLSLKAAEVLTLHQELDSLYDLFKKEGIPHGSVEYIRASRELTRLAQLPRNDLRKFLEADRTVGSSLVARLLSWAINLEEPGPLIELLVALGPSGLRKLNVAVGVQALKHALSLWQENKNNANEEFWQTSLMENSFVLEQVFSWPCSIVKDKAYVGGKNVTNTGGKIVDFLVKNRLTQNAALIEIKTPTTPLSGPKYRGIYNVSAEMTGALLQILDYKCSLEQHYQSLKLNGDQRYHSFDPRCIVIIGKVSTLKDDEVTSFELFRNQLANAQIIGFDELYDKTRKLVATLEAPPAVDDDEIDF